MGGAEIWHCKNPVPDMSLNQAASLLRGLTAPHRCKSSSGRTQSRAKAASWVSSSRLPLGRDNSRLVTLSEWSSEFQAHG